MTTETRTVEVIALASEYDGVSAGRGLVWARREFRSIQRAHVSGGVLFWFTDMPCPLFVPHPNFRDIRRG